jgi:predicted permease
MVELLLDAGADPNTTLRGGETALMTAARTGKPGPVQALLSRGAKVDSRERRLAAGSSVTRVRSEFNTLRARLDATAPRTRGGPTERNCPPQCERAPVLVTPYAAAAGGFLPAFEREILAVFSIVTLLTLVVVGANVANLMLARSIVRQRETAVRQSLGASRGRLVRLVIFEALAIAAVAGMLALVIAGWTTAFVPTLLPQGRGTMPVDFSLDWRVAIYAGVLTLAGTLLSSLLPALRAWKHDALPLLKDGDHTTTGGRSRVSKTLVVLQLAFSVLLLTAAGLAYRSGASATGDVGFSTENVLLVNVGTAAAVQSSAENLVLLDRIRQRLDALPNVTAATYTKGLWSAWNRREVRSDPSAVAVRATVVTVGDDYLETLGLDVVSGRPLGSIDRPGTRPTAVVSQMLASELFSGGMAVGRTLLIGPDRRAVDIVGIAPDAYYKGFTSFSPGGSDPRPLYVFVPDQSDEAGGSQASVLDTTITYHLRHTGSLASLVATVPAALGDVDRRIALASTETLDSRLDERAVGNRLISILLLVFASISLLIAGIGQYAVVAFNMRRRSRDFGVRIALGASGRDVLGSVMREASALTVAGLAIGFALSVALATALRAVLFGVTPTDAPTYAAVFALLAGVSFVASYVPARRASRINPVQALRQE